MSKRPTSVCSRASVERRRLADAAHLDDVVLGRSRRATSSWGGFGTRSASLVALGLGGRELLLGGPQLLLHALQLRELLGRRLALQLRAAAQLVDPRHERAPALVGLEQRVEVLGGALPRERGAVARRGRCGRP